MKNSSPGGVHNSKLLAVALFTLLVSAGAQAQTATSYEELPNFGQVNLHIYRGAQPRAGGIRRLAQLGIKTIINLRAANERTAAEEQEAETAGLRFINVPMPDFSRPSDEQVRRVLALLDDRTNYPVFIHCKRGADRTGVIIACYRITHDGWTDRQALAEAKGYGMNWFQRGMKDFVEDFYEQHAATGERRRACGQ